MTALKSLKSLTDELLITCGLALLMILAVIG